MFLWQLQALHPGEVFRRRINYMLAYKTYCGGTERTWQQPPMCGPLPTSHALETPDKTLTLEEEREGVGMKTAALAG